MARILVYLESPPNRKMVRFAISRVDERAEVVAVSEHAEAVELLREQSWDLAVIGLEPDEVELVELCARQGIRSLAGICVDTPEHEALARRHGATAWWQWPMQSHLLGEVIREQLRQTQI